MTDLAAARAAFDDALARQAAMKAEHDACTMEMALRRQAMACEVGRFERAWLALDGERWLAQDRAARPVAAGEVEIVTASTWIHHRTCREIVQFAKEKRSYRVTVVHDAAQDGARLHAFGYTAKRALGDYKYTSHRQALELWLSAPDEAHTLDLRDREEGPTP